MQVPASLRSDLYSHQTGIRYSHRRNTHLIAQFRNMTAPMIPIVGERPAAVSNTLASLSA
jgi:hypothetical protein